MALAIVAANDLPLAAGEQLDSDEDATLLIEPHLLLANDSDVDTAINAQVLSIVAVGGASHGQVRLRPDGKIEFAPEPDYNGPASFGYTVSDGAGGTATATAVVNLAAVNDAPQVTGETIAMQEDTPLQLTQAALLANDRDIDNPHADLRIVSVGNATHGVVSMGATGVIHFAPDLNHFGAASFTYTVADGAGGFTVGTAQFDIAAVNDAPDTVGETVRLNEDEVARFSTSALLANDSDVDNPAADLRIAAVGQATGGAVALVDDEIVFTPTLDFNGAASFTYTVDDGAGGRSEATVSLSFAPVNDAPVVNGERLTGKRDVVYTLTQAALLANDTDAESPAGLRVVGVRAAEHGAAQLNADGSVTFVPEVGYIGVGSFSYVVRDPEGAESTGTAEIDFSRVNVNPTAVDDSFEGYEDVAFAIGAAQLLANDSDADNAAAQLRISAVGQASNGTVSLDAQGNVRFEAAPNYNGQASFQYQLSDSDGGQTWATAHLNIAAVNDAPVIEAIWPGRPIYGYRWGSDGVFAWTLVEVRDEASALALAANPTDRVQDPGGNWVPNSLLDAHGREIAISRYQNGMVRPIDFSQIDATNRLSETAMDDPYRMNGRLIAWDPDGNSGQLLFSLAEGPQHGHVGQPIHRRLHECLQHPHLCSVPALGRRARRLAALQPPGRPLRRVGPIHHAGHRCPGRLHRCSGHPIHVGSNVEQDGAAAPSSSTSRTMASSCCAGRLQRLRRHQRRRLARAHRLGGAVRRGAGLRCQPGRQRGP
ncbi:MAG: tandem-95 repeat protein [Variovorax sp.]